MTVERRSLLGAPAATVWQRATTPAGINAELRPWMRMTVPPWLRDMTLDEVELGTIVCPSWVLLFGVIPFEYDDLVLVERGPGFRFLERSSTLMARTWQTSEASCRTARSASSSIASLLSFGRWWRARPAAMFRRVVRAIFAHRHRRLAAMYEKSPTPVTPT